MAEKEAAHIRHMEELALRGEQRERFIGQLFALGVSLAAFITAGIALFLGHETAASIIGGAPVAGLASAFIIGRLKKSSERKSPTAPV